MISRVVATALATTLVAMHSYGPWSSLARFIIVRLPPSVMIFDLAGNEPRTCTYCIHITLEGEREEERERETGHIHVRLQRIPCIRTGW